MIVFLLNIFLIIIEGLWLLYQVPTERNKKLFCILASLQWIIISGCRHISVGPDTQQYMNNFERVKKYPWSYVLDFARGPLLYESDAKAPGYTFLEKLFQVICKDYQIFLIVVAVVFFGCMGYSIYKNSKNPVLSFVLFSCLFYSFFAITGTRQTIATAIVVFIGIEFIKRRKFIPFLICVVILSTIHTSAVCFLPFFWIARIPIKKKTIAIYWCLIVLAYAFRTRFLYVLQLIVGYENYTQTEGARLGTFVYLLIIIALITTLFHKIIIINNYSDLEINVTDNKKQNITMLQMSINALFVACIFTSLLLINQNTMRVVQYYSLFLMYLLPEFSNIFGKRRDVLIYNVIVVVLLVLLMNKSIPYYFCWQNP